MLGSHYDTVLDAGVYDGALGVVVAISALKAALLELAPGAALRCPVCASAARFGTKQHALTDGSPSPGTQVEIVAFSDEEGVRFQSTFLGSKAVAGTLSQAALNATDDAGSTLAQARTSRCLERQRAAS